MFFFSLGAGFDLHVLPQIIVPSLVLAIIIMIVKPVVFRLLLGYMRPSNNMEWEISVRLGQVSEFSLLLVYIAKVTEVISVRTFDLLQATTIITFIISSYLIVVKYPTPLALSPHLRRD